MQSIHQPNTSDNPQHRGAAVPIYLRGTTRPVGRVTGIWFEKQIQGSKHLLRVPMLALAFDVSTLEDAAAAGATAVAVTDTESGRIYRTKVGCLRICEYGPTAVVYPEGTWYGGLTPENLDRVIEEDLANGHEVSDLVIGRNPLPG